MGLSNFVNNFLSSSRQSPRHSHASHAPPPPSDRAPKPPAPNPPRRRRHHPPSYKDDWGADWEPEWLLDDEPVSRELESRRVRRNPRRPRRFPEEPLSASSAAFPTRTPVKIRPSWDDHIPDYNTRPSLPLKSRTDERFDGPPSRSRRHNRDPPPPRRQDRDGPPSRRDDRDTPSTRLDDRDGPSSRRLSAWRRRVGRAKSNMEDSSRVHDTSAASNSSSRNPHPAFSAPSDYDLPISDSPPSLKRLIVRAREAAVQQRHESRIPVVSEDVFLRPENPTISRQRFKRESSASRDGSSGRNSTAKREGSSRRRAGRIMSNIDNFIRRDSSADSRSTRRRRLSTLSDAAGYVNQSSVSSSEAVSLVNESYTPPEREAPEQPIRSPPRLVTEEKPIISLPQHHHVAGPKPPPLPPPSGMSKPRRKRIPLPVQPEIGEHLAWAMKRVGGDGEPKMRVSADAVFPPRPRETRAQAFARSQSNPAPPTQPTHPGLKRAHLKRPPPLLTPSNGLPGFAFGVGADASGIRRVTMSRESTPQPDKERRSIDFPATTSAVTEESSDFNDISATPLETGPKGLPEMDTDLDEGILEPKAYAKSDIWNTKHSKSGGMSDGSSKVQFRDETPRPESRREIELSTEELFFFDEASQSSFGDTETPSKVAARHGIVPMDQRAGEVMEDNFVFGADESFSDGGFIISSDGRVDLPEKVERKMSDGIAVDGVPSSSSNVIFVRALSEFRKKYTFRDKKSKNGNPTLGRGAAGKVYLAVHDPSGLKIAVKEINIFDQNKRDQFKKELVTLIGHQSRFLVRSYGAFYGGNGGVHVALEYMDRGSLSDIVAQQGPIPEPVVRKIAEHCLRGLCFLHDNHILHRDVKTGNILLSRKLCRAKLSDFGLARNFKEDRNRGGTGGEGDGSSVTHTFVGTVLYMAPERLSGDEYTYASDIWGVGMAILECILGRYPFDKPQSYFDVLESAKSAPRALMEMEDISDELGDFVALAAQNNPKLRPTARELLSHPWIQQGEDNVNVLRVWLDSLPRLHCQNVEIGSELAFGAKKRNEAKAMAKIRAKAKETDRNMQLREACQK